jgi:fluoride exporter
MGRQGFDLIGCKSSEPKHGRKSRINFPPMLLWIGLGGAVGSVLRYLLGGVVQRSAHAGFPAGTLAVNVVGCFVIGVLAQHYMNVQTHPSMRAALITGFCGGFTTFSAFSLETVGLLRGGEYGRVATYVVLSVSLSLLATISGMAAAKAVA